MTAPVDRVAEIRQRLEAATPGPWRRPAANVFRVVAPDQPHHNPPEGMAPPYPWRIVCDTGAEDTAAADAALIAAAPADLAWLLSRLAVVEAERDELRAKVAAALALIPRGVALVTTQQLRRALSGTTEGPS